VRNTLTLVNLTSLARLRDEWIAAGLSTEPSDRAEAEAGVRDAYRAAGLKPPRAFVWLGSPLAGYFCACLLSRKGLPESLRNQATYGRFLEQAAEAGEDVLRQIGDPEAPPASAGADVVWARVRSHLWGGASGTVWDDWMARTRQAVRNQVRNAADRQIAALVPPRLTGSLRGWRKHVMDAVDVRIGGPVKADLVARAAGGADGGGERLFSTHLLHSLQGQHDAGWLFYYDYLARTLRLPAVLGLAGLIRVARSAGWWWPLPGLALLTERPERVERDAAGRLHSEMAPALRFRDGHAVYAWRGVLVSPRIALHAETITVPEILAERNVMVRHVLVERYGRERIERQLGDRAGFLLDPDTEVRHQDEFGTLYRLARPGGGEPVAIVKVVNATPEPDGTFKDYFLRVPPWVRTAREAVAWTFGVEASDYQPDIQT